MDLYVANLHKLAGSPLDNESVDTKGAPYGAGSYYAQAPFIDINNKVRSPSAIELVRENLATAFTCANLNAQLIASTPLRLYVRKTKRKTKSWLMERGETRPVSFKTAKWLQKTQTKMMSDATDVQEVTNHPLLDLLAHPMSMADDSVGASEYTLFEHTQAFQEIVGRCFWWKEPGGNGPPKALWILAPQLVQEYPGTDGKRIIDKYVFMSPWGKQDYDPSEIVPFRMPDLYTAGYLGGMSPLRAVIEKVRLARQVDANASSTLINQGKPSALFVPKGDEMGGGIGRDEVQRVVASMRMAFARGGQGGIAVTEFPGSLEILQWPVKDIIDISMYTMTRTDIANAFDVPTTLLDRKDSNLASAETGDYAHAKYAGIPRLKRNEAAMNQFLISEYDDSPLPDRQLFLAYDKPEGLSNPTADFERARNGANIGAFSVNDVLRLAGEPEIGPGGDVRFISNNMVPIDPKTGKPEVQPGSQKPVAPNMNSNGKRIAKARRY